MIHIIDTSSQFDRLFVNSHFQMDRWKLYIDTLFPGSLGMFLDDLENCTATGRYTYEQDFLPVLNAVYHHPRLPALLQSFRTATDGLDERVLQMFGAELDVQIVLYLGMCNGAGWATEVSGKRAILLGTEKILELNWECPDAMAGLIYHELGHIYHLQHGNMATPAPQGAAGFIWQLFCEGIAMCFEQALMGNADFYHQDHSGWKAWCNAHLAQIATDFRRDLPGMSHENQRYFGDWVCYEGYGDVGYYLGAQFVRHLLKQASLSQLIQWNQAAAYTAFIRYADQLGKGGRSC